jgi:GTP cyclohydrolase IIa
VTNVQLTLIQIDNYGPWTVTPEPRREVDLQTLQSRLYADLSQTIGNQGGLVFFTRFDNMVAVTNGLDRADHARIQASIRNRYPVTVSFAIDAGSSPATALADATARLQAAGSAQDATRTEILAGEPLSADQRRDDDVTIAHFDVVDATATYTDRMSAFDSFVHIEQGYAELMRHLHDEHEALAFFVGGDNVIAVAPDLTATEYRAAIEHVTDVVDVDMQVGVGRGRDAQTASMAAKRALESCRERAVPVSIGDADESTATTTE